MLDIDLFREKKKMYSHDPLLLIYSTRLQRRRLVMIASRNSNMNGIIYIHYLILVILILRYYVSLDHITVGANTRCTLCITLAQHYNLTTWRTVTQAAN